MGYLCCTKKIIDILGITPQAYKPEDDHTILGPWYVNLFLMERKKCLIFVNSKTLFSFVVFNQAKKDIMQIGDIFRRNLQSRLRDESIREDTIEKIMEDYEKITICKTSDKSTLGSMNELTFQFKVCFYMEEKPDIDDINKKLADIIMKLNKEYILPKEMLKKIIETQAPKEIPLT